MRCTLGKSYSFFLLFLFFACFLPVGAYSENGNGKIVSFWFIPSIEGQYCLFQIEEEGKPLYIRIAYAPVGKGFDRWQDIVGKVKSAVESRGELFILFDEGIIFRYSPAGSLGPIGTTEIGKVQRLFSAGSEGSIYAICLYKAPSDILSSTSKWRLYTLNRSGWQLHSELPAQINEFSEPFILSDYNRLMVFARIGADQVLSWIYTKDKWVPYKTIKIPSDARHMQFFSIKGRTVIAAVDSEGRAYLQDLERDGVIDLKRDGRGFTLGSFYSIALAADEILFVEFDQAKSRVYLYRFSPDGRYKGDESLFVRYRADFKGEPFVSLIMGTVLVLILIVIFRSARASSIIFGSDIERVAIAPLWRRLLAFVVDFFPISFIASIIFYDRLAEYTTSGDFFQIIGSINSSSDEFIFYLGLGTNVVYVIYCAICEIIFGKTLGKHVFSLKVIGASNLSGGITILQGFLRNAVKIIELYFFPLFIIAAMNAKRQRIGDMLADTIVVMDQ